VSKQLTDGQPAAAAAAAGDERRRIERRQHVLHALLYGSFNPRRRGPRRADERTLCAVDWHHPRWLAIAMLILVFSCIDAFLTLLLVEHGAYEVNPLMAPLIGGSSFALIKIVLTSGGVVLLTLLARLRAFGRIPVGALLYSVLALYGALITYEYHLLSQLIAL
jgi:hypothetical protein